MIFQAERAISPTDGTVRWTVIDEDFVIHVESTAYLAGLRALDRSINTERVYASRLALYLSYCDKQGLDWRTPSVLVLSRFLHWLVAEPLPPRGPKASTTRYRSKGTANAVLTTVCEFLRFGAVHQWVPVEVAAQLSEPKFLKFVPAGFDTGEKGEFRTVQAKTVRFAVAQDGYEWLADDQLNRLLAVTTRARDRFLVSLLVCTGVRIGEALGLRREDMHFLARADCLGCQVTGAHVHVRRRMNPNGALAKSRFARSIPVTDLVVAHYADYQHERDLVSEAAASDMVFVNLFRPPLGRPMGYDNAKDLFNRLALRAGFTARPHMLRHSAATSWIRAGVDRDVVQHLLGHVSQSSMEPYLHPTDQDKRDAVERVAAGRAGAR
ncbi:tyrosine-type recombinase/integrase [Lentzea albidocapillata]|uniref:tyrosine-type recombinase/integrase n=1 Tax=Lentzea albidocapillata TaxID=40571 RepID=UPI001C409BDA|nr:tyrosine-type recombinase/integrase [Lentzea albidocapillata]